MSAVVDYPEVRYAVIEGLQTETGHEHIIIAYPNEQLLRDLIAAPSILAFGFATRDQAVVAGRTCFSTAAAGQRSRTETMTAMKIRRPEQRLNWADRRGKISSALRRLGRFLVTSCSDVVNSAIIIFASSNTVSTTVRMALGSSV
ncbi:MAG: hypothetical protein WCC37_20915 [Candidatus Sulfotelmatobacter sp.]